MDDSNWTEHQLDVFIAVSQVISRTLELDRVLDDSLRAVVEFLRMDAGTIRLWDGETQELTLAALCGFSDSYTEETGVKKNGGTFVGEGCFEQGAFHC